ncbi:acyl-CoA synthetase family member 3, mitochondrial [Galendromus occidentalis]|uniref:Acyl-CoA synthetase family member 3, mitochondrial n=1 Tax=Galendromus occidentalis TaxID=34638 RepID=A0AAJ6QM92_9ACAR|nr:acyl-CoA synthetase family member 3, mitochondrial [Galendromus occidentalis]
MPNDHRYAVCQWAAWLSGLCAVPLHQGLPASLLDYHIKDSQSELVIVSEDLLGKLADVRIDQDKIIVIPELMEESTLEAAKKALSDEQHFIFKLRDRDAQIVYTSGTTGSPKGVVTSHRQIHAQTAAVVSEWALTADDTVLHHLPLHHVHGIVNALMAPLYAQAKVRMLPKFSPDEVWRELLREDSTVNVLMGVPTTYAKLIDFARERFLSSGEKASIRDLLQVKLRLCTCGSASLPDSILEAWRELTGHMLLERYGMSEFGMGLGNPLAEEGRKVGFVGRPFPGIEVRISRRDAYSKGGLKTLIQADKYSTRTIEYEEGGNGDLLIRGPQVFSSYFNRPEETKKSFTHDGWFITGDIASFDGEAFKILGRSSVDIIKRGGYKVSALEVERALLQHPEISEAAVFGIPDVVYGEKIVAAIVTPKGLVLSQVQEFCAKHVPPSSVPNELVIVESIPRNALGKVNKVEFKTKLFPNIKGVDK